ncbi:MAG: FAD-dependent oxidoreductase [Castellaniella sp.]|nr:FAD-dependent oxidoreductase [Castellaniella sp.]
MSDSVHGDARAQAPRILILGAGFAGLWAAVGAARKISGSAHVHGPIEILVVNARPFHSIRVRNYEPDLEVTKVPLADVLDPIGVAWLQATVTRIDVASRQVQVRLADGASRVLDYTRLVFALGSALVRPAVPGLAEHALDVDTYEGALRLHEHLASLPARPASTGRYTAIVIGAGLTGTEIASELPDRLARVAGAREDVRVILMDRNEQIAHAMGEAQPVIEQAMRAMGVELRPAVQVSRVTQAGVELVGGEVIPASTVIWCGGMRANELTAQVPGEHDELGRLLVDNCLRVRGVDGVFAAGDSARSLIDGKQPSIMSCQYGRPMGRFVGHNVAADLLGEPLLPLSIDWYTTIVDLGPWGAVYTQSRDRILVAQGAQAKRTKRLINRERIYPPLNRNRDDILTAGAPTVQTPPPDNVL